MILTPRAIGVLLTMALTAGGAAWGVHVFLPSGDGPGSDYGLDTNGNGRFEWLVVEADVTLPEAGTWDMSADLSTSSPPESDSCGSFGRPVPTPIAFTEATSYPIAWTYERYFFPAGPQTVRMAFAGADIARAGVDGPYAVRARLSLGGFPYPPLLDRPVPVQEDGFLEWNHTTAAYSASAFDPPFRPAYFTGPHTDAAVDVDSDGLADVLELTADVRVNRAGNYSLYGTLLDKDEADVVRLIAYGSRTFHLQEGDAQASLRFRGDQIRAAGVDGPWDFVLTLYPFDYPHLDSTARPADGRPGLFYPEMLCGSTGTYRAFDFDGTPELLRYTGRFAETTPDLDEDGRFDALVVRAEVEVFVEAGFDVVGTLRDADGTAVVARVSRQAWLSEGLQWTEFVFPGPDIRASGVDGPYEATLSVTPAADGIDPTTTYTTAAYRAPDFDDGATAPQRHWIGDLSTSASDKGGLSISVTVVRGNDALRDVIVDTLEVTVTDSAGFVVHASKLDVNLPAPGSRQTFSILMEGLSSDTYTVAALLGPPDRLVDSRSIVVTL